jgi:hypothetical protein
LRGTYSFDIEEKVLKAHLDDHVRWTESPPNPTLEGIRDHIQRTAPGIVHVTGFDNFQGTFLLQKKDAPIRFKHNYSRYRDVPINYIHDGMFLKNDLGQEYPCDAIAVADALTSGPRKPEIVSFNMYNSSARLAAFAVGLGARAALGFQDLVDDRIAEIFFANFYLNWRQSRWQTLTAYQETMRGLRRYKDKLQGTGIVLWTAESLLGQPRAGVPRRAEPQQQRQAQVRGSSPERIEIKLQIAPPSMLNYSILHNSRRPLFERFSVYKFHPLRHPKVDVEVELQMATDRFPYRQSFTMRDHVLELSERISVGLTSELARSLQEGVRATLFASLMSGEQRLFYETFRVTLLAVNEWRDDDLNRIWLPSFVLPREKGVLEIIMAAQRYLIAIQDNPDASFFGYQGVELNPDDTETVHSQVRAIWHALVHDFRLNYINPPPTFTLASQRLRTPNEIVRGRRGTCIDLALLIAACLEFIGIRPVIFLLTGHAFPGYWVDEERRENFLVGTIHHDLASGATEAFAQQCAWEFDKSYYHEIFDAVKRGDLILLESTLLASNAGFQQAMERGTANLQDPIAFDSMLEVGLARKHDVTPLPLAAEGEGRQL